MKESDHRKATLGNIESLAYRLRDAVGENYSDSGRPRKAVRISRLENTVRALAKAVQELAYIARRNMEDPNGPD